MPGDRGSPAGQDCGCLLSDLPPIRPKFVLAVFHRKCHGILSKTPANNREDSVVRRESKKIFAHYVEPRYHAR